MTRSVSPLVCAVLLQFSIAARGANGAGSGIVFDAPLFSDGMILQRGDATMVWGKNATPGATVTVTVSSRLRKCARTRVRALPCQGPDPRAAGQVSYADGQVSGAGSGKAAADGTWNATVSGLKASKTSSVTASDASSSATLNDVAVGDVLLCGGQSCAPRPAPPDFQAL